MKGLAPGMQAAASDWLPAGPPIAQIWAPDLVMIDDNFEDGVQLSDETASAKMVMEFCIFAGVAEFQSNRLRGSTMDEAKI